MSIKSVCIAIAITATTLVVDQAMADEPAKVIGCPGENMTLSSGVNVSETVCLKFYSELTGAPATATFWNIGLLGNSDLGTHTGSVCFDLSGPKYELRAGSISDSTAFYIFVNNTEVWQKFTLPKSVANRLVQHPIDIVPNSTPHKIDPCRPLCTQTDPPPLPKGLKHPKECGYDCYTQGRFGSWELVCNGMIYDKKTGKPKPAP